MANEVFSPEHSSLNGLFTEGIKYIIPAYQRPYSWESIGKSDRNNQINNMWDDFFRFYQHSNSGNKEYFFGSIVVFKKDGFSQVVDGQQRLTSLLLLFSAMKCFLSEIQNSHSDLEEPIKRFILGALSTFNKLLFNEEGLDLTQSLKVKIERASGFNFDEILNKVIRCEDKNSVLQNIESKYKDIAIRYFNNRDYFISKLKENFLDKKIFTKNKAEELNLFGRFLRTKISVIVINTINFETAYNMFEVLNNRGLPLSAKDLFRNFIISEFDKNGDNDTESRWNNLEENYEVTSDFLGRFVESKTNWLTDFSPKFRKEMTYKLGNFTLLTHNMNSKAKNYDFSRKKDEYKKTTLHITYGLSEKTSIDEDYISNRHKDIVNSIYEDLDLKV